MATTLSYSLQSKNLTSYSHLCSRFRATVPPNFWSSGDSYYSLKINDWLIRLKPEKHCIWHYQVRVWSWCFHSFFRKGSRGQLPMTMIICFQRRMSSWVRARPKSLLAFSWGSLDEKCPREWRIIEKLVGKHLSWPDPPTNPEKLRGSKNLAIILWRLPSMWWNGVLTLI